MPAPQITPRPSDARPVLGHVLLATNSPNLANSFTTAARHRLRQTTARASINPYALFIPQSHTAPAAPTQHLHDVLTRARSLYGAGMGFTSLNVLATLVRASVGLRWEDESELAELLAVIDADIGQAIQASVGADRSSPPQSSKEEIEGGRVNDIGTVRAIVDELRTAVKESMVDVKAWGGEFPFERAASSLEYWKI
ncbi:hypothetical protein DXG03_005139 [Asterophora parasitica]|uniref:Uncharacterized protein n=1 Tax=Asterophora parasitica TaxID=117018 RepID=A0A9P7FZP2_9AGAR|nr:hypothetical protein DXG03_005139 [Asterophora parasitica]